MIASTALGALSAIDNSDYEVPPCVSFVVPLFNVSPQILMKSLESVTDQSFRDFECIIVDESTEARSSDVCRDFCRRDSRFRHIQPAVRIGLAASLNLGISLARASLVARFDADDICMKDRLSLQVAFMSQHSEVGVLGGSLEIIDNHGTTLAFRRYPSDHSAIQRKMHLTTPLAHPTVIVRREVFNRCGIYDTAFRNAEDLDLWLRFSNGDVIFANLPEVLVRYRQQNTHRPFRHLQFNLKARLKNFHSKYVMRRILGIFLIFFWCAVPPSVQEQVFRRLLLRKVP
ncbi:MAG: glycosyltransferase [Gallionellaceae bacterium]